MAKSIFLVTLITSIYSSSKSKSSTNPIPGGVPQGSVLSPLLYSLYTRDFKPAIHSEVAELGITLDKYLTYKAHTDEATSKAIW